MDLPDPERWTIGLQRFRQVALITAAGLCLLVVAGGIVRLTGSGLGCDDWPNCNSTSFVDVSSGHTAIEQINRMLSGLISVPATIMIVGAFRARPRGRRLVGPSIGVLVSILANAVVGGIAVRHDLHPALVQSHFLLAMISITFALVAADRARPAPRSDAASPIDDDIDIDAPGVEGDAGGHDEAVSADLRHRTAVVRLLWLLAALAGAAIISGTVVTGTGPHAGDETARRWNFDISDVARVHSSIVIVTVAAALVLLLELRSVPSLARRVSPTLSTWLFLAVVQGGIGYVQYFTGVPELLVGAHLAGATALWVATVQLVLVGRRDERGADGANFTRLSENSLVCAPNVGGTGAETAAHHRAVGHRAPDVLQRHGPRARRQR